MELNLLKSEIFFLKQRMINKQAMSFYTDMLNHQYLSSDELAAINWKKRLKLINYVYYNVPFYRIRFDELNLHPNDIVIPEDFKKIPILTRNDVKINFHNIVTPGIANKYKKLSTTGGSTGTPVKVLHDNRFPMEILGWRMLDWWGLRPGIDIAFVYRLTRPTELQRLINRMLWWPTRRIWLDASSMHPSNIYDFIVNYNRIKPKIIQGYTGSIYHLTSFIKDNSIKIHFPDAVWVTSSPITDFQRNKIQDVFNAPVYNQYGCGEVFWLGAQCKQRNGLHIFYDYRHIEFIDDSDKDCPVGTIGNIVITDLENYVFPIIRYSTGDLGRSLNIKCNCGINLPLMDEVKGRITDNIYLPDGTCIGGDYVTTIFDEFPDAVNNFQVIQEPDFSINILYVPNQKYNELQSIISLIQNKFIEKTKGQITINIQKEKSIHHDRGKTRFVISNLNDKMTK